MVNTEDLILLNTIETFGYKNLLRLLAVFRDTSNILKAAKPELISAGINKDLAEKIAALDRTNLSDELRLTEREGVKAISIFDKNYPENLKNIYSPPVILYAKGEMAAEDADSVAIVGSRRPSYYGVSICERLSGRLASMGITIISGFARGIDTAAHRGAIKNGRTVAVLGSGLNCLYPQDNVGMVKEICQNGALISEFPMQTPPNRRNFPKRNRIISGLSLGVLVVEASEKSGSLITANFALEENRELFAIPGQVGSGVSAGTNNLIKRGAKLVEDTDDIIEEIKNNLKYTDAKRQNEDDGQESSGGVLTDEEKKVKGLLSREPAYIDELAEKSNMNVSKVGTLLLSLELKNVIKELPGKNFVLK